MAMASATVSQESFADDAGNLGPDPDGSIRRLAAACLLAPADAEPSGPTLADDLWAASQNLEWHAEAPAPAEPRLPFADLIGVEASYYRSKGTSFGDWMAATLDALASEARFLGATNPADFDDRSATMELWDREAEAALAEEGGEAC